MRSPFDSNESSWWAVHGASSSFPPPATVELEPAYEAATDDVASQPGDVLPERTRDALPDAGDELSQSDLLSPHDRPTVKDLGLVRVAAAMCEQPFA